MGFGFEKSDLKKEVWRELLNWNYQIEKATAFNIAKKINCSESAVSKILRALAYEKLASSHKGSWALT
jgi:predicted transcriptional regulator